MHTEPWAKVTVVLLDRHVAFLDQVCIDIRPKHRKALSRAEIIRALVEAAFVSGVDLSEAVSEESIVQAVNGAKKKTR